MMPEKSKYQSHQGVNPASYNNSQPDSICPLCNSYECYRGNQQLSDWIKGLLYEMELVFGTIKGPRTCGYIGHRL